ncbi:MAG: hypothetical protein EOO42_24055 [Flavobacteriales bacterium]|nr:MAG: hypothetical protein EOO42_24055 [Flavobacteriales bacterium]
MLYKTVNVTNGTGNFIADPNNQAGISGTTVPTYEVNLLANNFKIPQTLRYNLGLDMKLPGGIIGTLEGIYSSTVNNILYQNANLKAPVGTLPTLATGGADTRPLYNYPVAAGKVNSTFTNAIVLNNTNKGSSYNLTAQLQKNFMFGLSGMFAYTYGKSRDINSGTSSTAGSNYSFVQIVTDPNNPPLAYSNYDVRHRMVGSLSYGVKYGKNKSFGTTASLVYVGKSGTPFTYLYNGDLNQDGNNGNDLFFVPRSLADIRLAIIPATTGANPQPAISIADQWAALDKFISNDPYLSTKRGQLHSYFLFRGL